MGALGLLALVASCTLTRTTVDSCTTNTDCRNAFGIGRICGAGGFCDQAVPNPRCTRSFPEDLLLRPESYPNAIIFGSLVVASLENQRARENATRLAIKEVNEQGGLDGRLFGVVFCDVSEDPKYDSLKRTDAAVASGTYLADVIGAPAFVGPSASTDVISVFNALKGKGVLIMSPSATSPDLTAVDVPQASDEQPGLLWRTAVPDTVQGAVMARYLGDVQPPITNVSIVFEKGAYGEGLEKVFRGAFTKDGRTLTSKPFTAGNTGERTQAAVDAISTTPQYVLFFSSQSADQSAFINGVNTVPEYQNVKLFLADTAANADLLKNTPGAAAVYPRITGTRPSVPAGRVFDVFKFSYNAAYTDDPNRFTFVPHDYDGTWLVLYGSAFALRREGSITGLGIAKGLRHVASAGPTVDVAPGNWKQIIDTLGNDKPVNLVGASGNLDYDPSTEETKGDIDIWNIDPGAPNGPAIVKVITLSP